MADKETLGIKIKSDIFETKQSFETLQNQLKITKTELINVKKVMEDGKPIKYIAQMTNGLKKFNTTIDNETGKVLKRVEIENNKIGKSFNWGKIYAVWNLTKKLRSEMFGSVQKAIDFNEAVNKFNVSMGSSSDQAMRFQNRISEAFGTARKEMMDYQSTFKNILGGLGDITTKQSEKISESLIQMGLDYSSLFNVSQASAMNKFQGALVGSIMPIRRDSGYDVSRNAVVGKATELGISRNYQQLNETEKRLIRILLLMEQLKNTGAFQDMSRTIEEPSAQIKVLKNQLQELSMWLGQAFVGTLGGVLPYINGFVMALKEMAKALAFLRGFTFKKGQLEDPLQESADSANDIASGFGSANKQAKELKKTLMGFDVLNVITTPKEPKGGSGRGPSGIDPKILEELTEYDSIMDNVRMKALDVRDSIMDWLGFTKQINPLTGEISWKLREGFTNLKLIGGIIKTTAGLFIVSKIIKLIGGISTLKKVLVGTIAPTTKFQAGLASLGKTLKVGKHSTLLKGLVMPIAKVAGAIGGVIASIKGVTSMFKIYDKTVKNETVTNKEMWGSVIAIVGGLTALGAVLGGPIGAVIGVGAGLIAALTTNSIAMNKAIKQLAEERLFGDLTISIEQWNNMLASSDTKLKDYIKTSDSFKSEMQDLSSDLYNAKSNLELYLAKFNLVSYSITEQDIKNINEGIKSIGTNAISMVKKTTDRTLSLWHDTFQQNDNIIDEGEKSILSKVLDYGRKQEETIKTAQDNITTTYQNAINTRGYLTDEEKRYIEEQLAKIEEITNKSMTQGETDMEYYVEKSKEYSKETYNNFKQASEEYLKGVQETSSRIYNEKVNSANALLEQGVISNEEYNNMVKLAGEERENQEKESNSKVEESRNKLLDNLAKKYEELEEKTDKTSKAMRKEIENVFKDYHIDASDIVSYSSYNLQQKGREMGNQVQKGFKGINWGKFHMGIDPDTGKFGMKWFANGGLPDVGEMFIAREAGPELVGKIGNSNAVVNNQQIVEAVSSGVAQAVSSVMGGQQGGSYQFYFDGEQITDVVMKRMDRNANMVGI